jgi:ParB family chromosome partitioning protein
VKLVDIPIEQIHYADRYRRDAGDIDALAANIRELGLLQPIGIDEFYNLIYGLRRLHACENLGWRRIPCVVVKLNSLILGEYAENEFRKQFTQSERIAIGKAIEAELGAAERRGGDRRANSAIAENAPKGNTVDLAAKRAGFKSAETYERAKVAVDKGTPELVAAMDAGKISIDAAAKIASQPKAEQARIIKLPKEEQREVVRQIRQTRADREKDEKRARDIKLFRGLYNAVKFIADFHEEPKDTWGGLWRVSAYDFSDHLNRALEYLPKLKRAHPNETKRPVKVN